MSVEAVIKGPRYIEARRTVVLNQNLSTLGSGVFTLDLRQYQIAFVPTRMFIRQILYSNIAGGDNGIFSLWCSIPNQHVAALYVGIQANSQMPETCIPIYAYSQNINFHLDTVLPGSFGTGTNGAPTGFLTVTLEFTNAPL